MSPATIQLALSSKSHADIAFVTDAVAPQAIGTKIAYESRVMEVMDCLDYPDNSCGADTPRGTMGCVVLAGTTTLAGSCTTMHDIFCRLVHTFRCSIADASGMCSEVPARIARLPHVGRLQVGCRADMVVFHSEDTLSTICDVFVAGRRVSLDRVSATH